MRNLSLILASFITLVSCTVEPLSTNENVSQNEIPSTSENTTNLNTEIIPNFMSANINGIQFNNLKPMDYVDASTKQVTIETYTTEGINYKYLLIQGSNITMNSFASNESLIINLRIPQSQWTVGTYDLVSENSTIMNGSNSSIGFYDLGRGNKTVSVEQGSIRVTDFDIAAKRIKGNFNITYYLITNNDIVEGPFTLTNGTFNYELDDPYFQ